MLDGSGPRCASGNIFTVDCVELQLIKGAGQNAVCVSLCTGGVGQKVKMLS